MHWGRSRRSSSGTITARASPFAQAVIHKFLDGGGGEAHAGVGGAVVDVVGVVGHFDCEGEAYSSFVSRLEQKAPGLINILVIEQFP